jgi:hypothetical protein
MNHADTKQGIEFENVEYRNWLDKLWRPVVTAAAIVTILLLLIVVASKPAWDLLGAGRGFIPEELYLLSGFFLVLGTTFGQAIGWAIGTGIAIYLMTLFGYLPDWKAARIAMSIVYFGLLLAPLFFFHILYGGWLLGIPRPGLADWLWANHPGAAWLLLTAHPIVDLSLIPLAIIFLWILWRREQRLQGEFALQTGLALSLLGTSLMVALSLAIHSTLVHVRVGL